MKTLRPYQIDLIQKSREAYRHGKTAPCIVLPCGGGKSVIVADIAKKATQKHNRVLFLVHRKELCEQIENTFKWWGVDMDLCDVMMVQTATRRIKKIKPPALIITDENHHSKSTTYRRIYDSFPNAKRIGVTATPWRLDGSGLKDVNDELVVGVSAKWLIENHYLSPYDYYAPTVADLSGIKIVRGEFEVESVEIALMKKAVYGNVIENYRKFADGKQAICYCASIRHSAAMAEEFCSAGISAKHIDGNTPKSEREQIISDFRKGEVKILCNVDLISEGFDVPDCECAILIRPTKSLTLYIQQSMRCMRYKYGKRAVILDHVGNYAIHGMPDADRQWSLAGRKKNKRDDSVSVTMCPNCYQVFGAPKPKICPNCGYELVSESESKSELEKCDCELKKITGFVLEYDSPEQCRSMKELQAYAKKHGYKSGWCYYQAKKMGWIV